MLMTKKNSQENTAVDTIEWDSSMSYVHAKAPATASNLAVGFDSLGLALAGPFDEVILQKKSQPGIQLTDISPAGDWPLQVDQNTATIAMQAFLADHPCPYGFEVQLIKGIPLGSGMGGSAASAVAAVSALNGFCHMQLSYSDLLAYVLHAEKHVSGGVHPDNAVPALWGGLTLSYTHEKVVSLPIHQLTAVLLHPDIRIDTKDARKLLPQQVCLHDHITMNRRLAAWVACIYQDEYHKMAELMQDDIVEPARMKLWPYYKAIKQQTLDAGALAVCISGSGPSMLALVQDNQQAKTIADVMQQACQAEGYACHYWISQLPAAGSQIVEKFS